MTDNANGNKMSDDSILQAILSAMRESEKKVKMLDPTRYLDVLLAKDALDTMLLQSGEECKAAIKMHHAFSAISVCAEVEMLEVHDIKKFNIVAGKANVFEILPLTNGKVSIAFTFQNVLIPIE